VGRTNWTLQVEAVSTLEAEGPSPDLVRGLGLLTFIHLISDRPAEAMATAGRAIELAATLGLAPPAGAYAWRGSTRCLTGDPGGLDDGRMAIALATAAGTAREAAIYRNEYAGNVAWFIGARAAELATTDLVEFAASRGLRGLERLGRAGLAYTLWGQGNLVEAEAIIRSSIEAFEAAGDLSGIPNLRGALMQLATLRGDTADANGLAATLETDPHLEDSPDSPGTLAAIARAYAEDGDLDGARRVLARMATQEIGAAYRGGEVLDAVIAALAIGDRNLIASHVDASDDQRPFGRGIRRLARALVAEADGDLELAASEFDAAAAILDALWTPHHTHARLGLGSCLVALGRADQAINPLTEARDLAERMGARPWVAEADALLAEIETPAG
jgi:tetratricopeptide (TPR) repeat protein